MNQRDPDDLAGRDIIDEVARHMRSNSEALRYSIVVPGAYSVYLHPDDHERLEGIVPQIVDECGRALDEALERLNRPGRLDGVRDVVGLRRLDWRRRGDRWDVRVFADPNGEVPRGDLFVVSSLAVDEPGSWSGSETRRVRTSRSGERTETRESAPARSGAAGAERGLATIAYRDENGDAEYVMRKEHIVVGRGGSGHWVDLKLRASSDVSREHVRIRFEPGSGGFFIRDVSRFGTAVNGQAIPSSIEERDGERVDVGIEVPLASPAEISLAGVLVLRFRAPAGA